MTIATTRRKFDPPPNFRTRECGVYFNFILDIKMSSINDEFERYFERDIKEKGIKLDSISLQEYRQFADYLCRGEDWIEEKIKSELEGKQIYLANDGKIEEWNAHWKKFREVMYKRIIESRDD